MKPIDEDVEDSDTEPEDQETEDEDFDLEVEIKKRATGRRRRRTGKEYGSMISFIAWIAFVIIWLLVYAGGFDLFSNIAIVFVTLLVAVALNAVIWIPSFEGGWRAKVSAVGGIAWLIFVIVWLLFLSTPVGNLLIGRPLGLFENIAVILDSLLFIGALNVLMWVPSPGEGMSSKISAIGGIGWLMFLIYWAPFQMEEFSIYRNVAVFLLSFLIMIAIVITPWRRRIRVDIDVGLGRRPEGSFVVFIAWILFIIAWMWVFAEGQTAERNTAVVLLSVTIVFAILLAMWAPWARKRGEGPESWKGIGIGFAWLISLTIWFWAFAGAFNPYQNFAVFLVSLLIAIAIGGGFQWKKYRDFEALDWDD
jgi:hypothetical protein